MAEGVEGTGEAMLMGRTWNPFTVSGNGGAENDVRGRFGGRGFVIEMAKWEVRESKIENLEPRNLPTTILLPIKFSASSEMPSSLEAEPVDDAPTSLKRPILDGYHPFVVHSNTQTMIPPLRNGRKQLTTAPLKIAANRTRKSTVWSSTYPPTPAR
jgi:hypothetical protein